MRESRRDWTGVRDCLNLKRKVGDVDDEAEIGELGSCAEGKRAQYNIT